MADSMPPVKDPDAVPVSTRRVVDATVSTEPLFAELLEVCDRLSAVGAELAADVGEGARVYGGSRLAGVLAEVDRLATTVRVHYFEAALVHAKAGRL